ncbi:hypothetical protein H0H92_014060 [Tricholoma furcatifolium]|nr:hypothetical protein H0H92_014060 [Tricholoma furcatifolium]
MALLDVVSVVPDIGPGYGSYVESGFKMPEDKATAAKGPSTSTGRTGLSEANYRPESINKEAQSALGDPTGQGAKPARGTMYVVLLVFPLH